MCKEISGDFGKWPGPISYRGPTRWPEKPTSELRNWNYANAGLSRIELSTSIETGKEVLQARRVDTVLGGE